MLTSGVFGRGLAVGFGGGAAPPIGGLPLPILLGADLWLPLSWPVALWTNSPAGINETHASADGNLVGQIDAQGLWPGFCIAGSSSAPTSTTGSESSRGTLGSTSRLSSLTRTTSHLYVLERSTRAFRYMYVEKVCTLIFFVHFTSDGSTCILWDTIKGSATTDGSTAAGWYLGRTSSNTIQILVANGAGALMVNTTTTGKTVTNANGMVMIAVTLNGHGASLGKIRAYSCATGAQLWAEHAFATNGAAAAAAGTNTTRNVGIGGYADGTSSTQRLVGHQGDILTFDRVLTDQELSQLALWNPPRTSATLARALAAGTSLPPTSLSGCLMWFDFLTAGTWNFQERTSPTTPAADGQPLGYSFNRAGSRLHRDMVAQSDGERPIWTDDLFGAGLGAISFSGADAERMDFPALPKAGNITWLIAGRQQDASDGSQVLRASSGSIYATQTKNAYESVDDCYWITHDPVAYYGRQGGIGPVYDGEALHAWGIRFEAPAAQVGVGGQWGTAVSTPGSVHNFDRMGASASHDADFDPTMDIAAVCCWKDLHSQADWRKVMQYFIDLGLAVTVL